MNKKFLYIRLPKTGSTSLSDILTKNNFIYLENDKINSNRICIEPLRLHRKGNIGDKFFENGLSNEYEKLIDLESFYKFTIVRNPYNRIVSGWKYLMNHQKIKSDILKKEGKMDFKTFIEYININYSTLSVRDKWHIHPISELLKNMDIQKVIKMEKLQTDFEQLRIEIGLKGNIGHLNNGKIDDYHSHYDQQTLKIVNKIFKEDFEKYNYKKIT